MAYPPRDERVERPGVAGSTVGRYQLDWCDDSEVAVTVIRSPRLIGDATLTSPPRRSCLTSPRTPPGVGPGPAGRRSRHPAGLRLTAWSSRGQADGVFPMVG